MCFMTELGPQGAEECLQQVTAQREGKERQSTSEAVMHVQVFPEHVLVFWLLPEYICRYVSQIYFPMVVQLQGCKSHVQHRALTYTFPTPSSRR